jgi:hypothetical protein
MIGCHKARSRKVRIVGTVIGFVVNLIITIVVVVIATY